MSVEEAETVEMDRAGLEMLGLIQQFQINQAHDYSELERGWREKAEAELAMLRPEVRLLREFYDAHQHLQNVADELRWFYNRKED